MEEDRTEKGCSDGQYLSLWLCFFSGIFGRRFELDIPLQSNIEHKEK
jgi:hypothetical protein